jgi:hypothetical protein
VNDLAIALALLNWNDMRPSVLETTRHSRGQLIPALLSAGSSAELQSILNSLNLKGMLPFCLVGVFPSEKVIREWRWDSVRTSSCIRAWGSRHWFSSSLSDKRAERSRGAVCRAAMNEADARSAPWLRRLHGSHAGGADPFSLCVHRPDMETLSYTEIYCKSTGIHVGHSIGNPCANRTLTQCRLERGSRELR